MEISKRIKNLRQMSGLTQRELAHELFVTRQAVSKWESGKGTPDIFNLLAMTKIFSVSLDQLVEDQQVDNDTYHFQTIAINLADLDYYKPHGKPIGSKRHTAVINAHPQATIWSLSRVAKNTWTQEILEWMLALGFDTPFGIFSIADSFSDRAAYYLAEKADKGYLVKVGKTAVESIRLKERFDAKTLTVGKDRFRKAGRVV